MFVSSYHFKATDKDTGKNKETKFEVTKVDFVGSEGTSSESLFLYADSANQEDAEGKFSAHIRWEIQAPNLFVNHK